MNTAWSVPALVLWTVLTMSVLSTFDHAFTAPRMPLGVVEVLRSIAIVVSPVVVVLTCLVWGLVQLRRRLRRLAATVILAPVLAWLLAWAIKILVHRGRPPALYDYSIAEIGSSYPSSHVALVATAAILVVVMVTVQRRRHTTIVLIRQLAIGVTIALMAGRWLVNANWIGDLVAGLLVAVVATSVAALVTGLTREPLWHLPGRGEPGGRRRRVAVVYNPMKVGDTRQFTQNLSSALARRGWDDDPLMISTTEDDPGYAMTRQALDANVDLVIASGGDGTVRVVSSELAHAGVPLAIIPSGTANLLAVNLGIPQDMLDAVSVALDGDPQPIDLIRVTIDGNARAAEHFAVMGGLGIDGKIMAGANPELKKAVKSVAYFVAVAQNLNTAPVPATITVDGKLVSDNPASLMLVGNVGEIQAGLSLFPHASATDGEFDFVVAGPANVRQWLGFGWRVLRRQNNTTVNERRGRHLMIQVADPLPYQLDGDHLGEASTFEAEVVPGALRVMLPPRN